MKFTPDDQQVVCQCQFTRHWVSMLTADTVVANRTTMVSSALSAGVTPNPVPGHMTHRRAGPLTKLQLLFKPAGNKSSKQAPSTKTNSADDTSAVDAVVIFTSTTTTSSWAGTADVLGTASGAQAAVRTNTKAAQPDSDNKSANIIMHDEHAQQVSPDFKGSTARSSSSRTRSLRQRVKGKLQAVMMNVAEELTWSGSRDCRPDPAFPVPIYYPTIIA